jgi:E3 ubiquitin-protein ligase HUWE1
MFLAEFLRGQFLEGLFQHTGHCREFVSKSDGVNLLIRLYDLPSLPANFCMTPAAQSIVSVMRAMAEAVPTPTLERLLGAVRESLDQTRPIWKMGDEPRRPTSFLEVVEGSDVVTVNDRYRRLLTLHLRINMLSHVYYSTAGYTHGRSTNVILQIVGTGTGPSTIEDLAEMYRVFLWEGVVLKGGDPGKQLTIEGTHVSLANGTPSTSSTVPLADSSNKLGASPSEPKVKIATSIQEDNARAIRTLVQNLSKVTTPLFQGTSATSKNACNPWLNFSISRCETVPVQSTES